MGLFFDVLFWINQESIRLKNAVVTPVNYWTVCVQNRMVNWRPHLHAMHMQSQRRNRNHILEQWVLHEQRTLKCFFFFFLFFLNILEWKQVVRRKWCTSDSNLFHLHEWCDTWSNIMGIWLQASLKFLVMKSNYDAEIQATMLISLINQRPVCVSVR